MEKSWKSKSVNPLAKVAFSPTLQEPFGSEGLPKKGILGRIVLIFYETVSAYITLH